MQAIVAMIQSVAVLVHMAPKEFVEFLPGVPGPNRHTLSPDPGKGVSFRADMASTKLMKLNMTSSITCSLMS